MPINTKVQGSDIAGTPQGATLYMILAELRVHTILLQSIVTGVVNNDDPYYLRADQAIEPVVTRTTVLGN